MAKRLDVEAEGGWGVDTMANNEDTVMTNAPHNAHDEEDERMGRDERVNLYVRGVGEGVKDSDLVSLFGKYGEVCCTAVLYGV